MHYRDPHRRSSPQNVESTSSSKVQTQPPTHILSPLLDICYVCTSARGSLINHSRMKGTIRGRPVKPISPPLQHPILFTPLPSGLCNCFLKASCTLHSSLITTKLVHRPLRCQRPTQRDDQPATPLRTRQQVQSPTHQLTGVSSTTALLTHSRSRP